jgi:hypothetical protein
MSLSVPGRRRQKPALPTSQLVDGHDLGERLCKLTKVSEGGPVVLLGVGPDRFAELLLEFEQNEWDNYVLLYRVVLVPNVARLVALTRLLCNRRNERNDRAFRLLATAIQLLQLLRSGVTDRRVRNLLLRIMVELKKLGANSHRVCNEVAACLGTELYFQLGLPPFLELQRDPVRTLRAFM